MIAKASEMTFRSSVSITCTSYSRFPFIPLSPGKFLDSPEFSVTFRSLPGHFPVTSGSLSGHFPVTSRSLPGHFRVTLQAEMGPQNH